MCVLGTGNEIIQVDGLDGMRSLTELVLDRNKIKVGVDAHKPRLHCPAHFAQTLENSSLLSMRNLRELHIEENRQAWGKGKSCDCHMTLKSSSG